MCDNNIVDIPISWEFGKESIYEKPNNRKKHRSNRRHQVRN